MGILVIVVVLIGHWVSDLIFQSNNEIEKKWSDVKAVLKHAAEYSVVMSAVVLLLLFFTAILSTTWYFILNFWLMTFVFHFIVDYFLSKAINGLWNKQDRIGFFSIMITDQTIHLITLFLTISYLFY
jgi:hypothetical protein